MDATQGLWGKFWALSCLQRWLFIEAVLLHFWIGLLLKVLPFRRIPGFFGRSGVLSWQSSVGSLQSAVRGHRIDQVRNSACLRGIALEEQVPC